MKFRFAQMFCSLLVFCIVLGCSSQPSSTEEVSKSSQSAESAKDNSKGLLGGVFSKREPVTIPAGTAITVQLQNSISSKTASPGDTFSVRLASPIVINGKTVAPAGASGTGRVVSAHKSGRLQDPGYLQLALSSLEAGGKEIEVQSSSVALKGSSHKKRNLGWIGGGAAGGALIGGLAGGGKGALIGSAVGAGSGTAAAAATGKKDVVFSAERHLTFRLAQPITVEM